MNEEPPTKNDQRRLDCLFYGLWSHRTGVRGSWGSSSYRYHPTWILRGSILLHGDTAFRGLHVVTGEGARVIPVEGNSTSRCSVTPHVRDGALVMIHDTDPGPWWQAVRDELPIMEAELDETVRQAASARNQETKRKVSARDQSLAKARAAIDNQ